MKIRFNHLAVQVKNVECTLAWYQEFFEGDLTWRMDGGFSQTTLERLPTIKSLAEIKISDLRFHIFDSDLPRNFADAAGQPNFQHCGIEVSSSTELRMYHGRWHHIYLSERYNYFGTENSTDIITEDDGTELFYCLDPNGLEFEFFYKPA